MARLSDKEFSLRYELTQLQRDRNRLERLKERTDDDLSATRQRIKAIKDELSEKPKPKKKAAPKVSAEKLIEKIEKNKKTFEAEDVEIPEESEVKIDANSMTAIEDSKPVKAKKKTAAEHTVELKEKAEDKKTDPAE